MSELQDIATEVNGVAGEIAALVQQLNAAAVNHRQAAARTHAAVGTSSDPRPKQVIQQFEAAAQRCEQAAQALQLAEHAAKRFVGRAVGGSGGTISTARASTPSSHAGEALSAPQQSVVAVASQTGVGTAYFAPNDVGLRTAANEVPPFPGEYVLDLHGEPNRVSVQMDATDQASAVHLSATEFAAVVRSSHWSGEPIRLFSCNTGCDPNGFAQQLANALGVTVTAPDAPVWTLGDGKTAVTDTTYVMTNGRIVPKPILPDTGRWQVFTPQ